MAVIETRRRKDGSTSYRVRISLKGHPRVSETFRRKTDAKRWAQSTEAAIRERRYFPGSEAERRTVGELVDRFIAEKLQLRPERYHQRLERQLRREHGDPPNVATRKLERLMAARKRDALLR